jgi:Spy/CpxP family protein refolding chaperone
LESLVAALPGDLGYELRSDFNRLAFPSIHGDPGALDRKLNQALKLDSLTPDQRQKLNDLVAEYRPAYAAFCEQMVNATSGSEGVNLFGGDPEDVEKWQAREEAMEKLRFDRNELNSRGAQKLKGILNSEQLAQIGGLPTASE